MTYLERLVAWVPDIEVDVHMHENCIKVSVTNYDGFDDAENAVDLIGEDMESLRNACRELFSKLPNVLMVHKATNETYCFSADLTAVSEDECSDMYTLISVPTAHLLITHEKSEFHVQYAGAVKRKRNCAITEDFGSHDVSLADACKDYIAVNRGAALIFDEGTRFEKQVIFE